MTISSPQPSPPSSCALFCREDVDSCFHQLFVVMNPLQMAVVAAVSPALSKNANYLKLNADLFFRVTLFLFHSTPTMRAGPPHRIASRSLFPLSQFHLREQRMSRDHRMSPCVLNCQIRERILCLPKTPEKRAFCPLNMFPSPDKVGGRRGWISCNSVSCTAGKPGHS